MRLRLYIVGIILLGGLASYLVMRLAPADPGWALATVGTLAALALTAELMGFLLPRGATASISFVPYMTALLLVPNVAALLAVGGGIIVGNLARKNAVVSMLFNTAQMLLAYSVGIAVYRMLGGVSLFALAGHSASEATLRVGVPMTMAYLVVYAVNSLAVSHAVAASTGARTLQVWRDNNLTTIGLDVLALPLVFAFAWIYANYGAMFASLIWLPVLGLRQMNTANLELAQTNRELLELMIKSIEARDPYTSGHSRRVKDYAVKIARLLELPSLEVEKIGTAALLHDVGKIYDKYAPILAKEDRLSTEEWAVIKEHPLDGANLIATMTRLRELVPAVKHHHENWDGTGYPDGLREEDIPLASRIIMFADTLDAMTTKRPYRGPLGESAVRGELVRCRGRQFDPTIADRLLAKDFWNSLFPPAGRVPARHGLLHVMSGGAKN